MSVAALKRVKKVFSLPFLPLADVYDNKGCYVKSALHFTEGLLCSPWWRPAHLSSGLPPCFAQRTGTSGDVFKGLSNSCQARDNSWGLLLIVQSFPSCLHIPPFKNVLGYCKRHPELWPYRHKTF